MSVSLTLSGNEITDTVRAAATSGDGLSPESSMGIWEATTNLIANGGLETNTTGYTQVSATLSRITSDYKFGAACGQIVTGNAAANEGAYHTFTATAAPYTVSCWVKGSGGGTVRVAVRDNAGANPTTGTAVTLTSSWQRISVTTGNLSVATWRAYVETNSQQNITFLFDGLQAELQPLATPYVETNGATASRSASLITFPVSGLLGSTGWVALRARVNWGDSNEPHGAANPAMWSWAVAGSSPGDYFWIFRDVGTNRWGIQLDGAAIATVYSAVALTAGDYVTLIGRFVSATSIGISVNGSAFADTSHSIAHPSLDTVSRIGSLNYTPDTRMGDSDFFWFACGTGTLTDADAATIHAIGNSDMYPADFPGSCTMVWRANTSSALDVNDIRPTGNTHAMHYTHWA